VYDLLLLGRRISSGDAAASALGGSMQLLEDSLAVMQANPAMLSLAKRVTFGVAQYVTGDQDESTDLSRDDVSYRLSTFIFAFPVHRRLSVGIGFRARYDADGVFTTRLETSEGAAYDEVYQRSGGLSSIPLTLAADVTRFLRVGGFASLERGTIENLWVFDFASGTARDASSLQRWTLRGTGWGAGVVLRPVRAVTLGAHYESQVDYDTEVEERHTNDSANANYTETTVLPERWTGSLLVRIGQKNAVHAGVSVSDFADFRGLAFPRDRLGREQMVAVGFERRRALAGAPVRISATYGRLPYTLPAGETLERVGGAIGTGLSLGGGKGKIDLALEYARTGSVGTNSYENRMFRFYVGVGGGETWRGKQVDE
jgi:hypothetical protein